MSEESESLTIEIPLDPLHRRGVVALEEQGVVVEEIATEAATPVVEKAIYEAVQQLKYENERH